MRVLSTVLALVVSFAIVGALSAQEPNKGRRPERRPGAGGMDLMRMFKDLDLSADQLKSLQDLSKEYGPKFKALNEKREKILTADQKKAGEEARKAAMEAKKTPREAFQAMREAWKITDEQKAAFAEVQKEFEALNREWLGKALEVLTPEQREKMKNRLERFQNRKPKDKEGKENKKTETI